MNIDGKLYKILKADGSAIYGCGKWHLPKGDKPGKWMPVVKKLSICESGYHLTNAEHLIGWLNEAIFEAEYKGDVLDGGDKIAVSQARLIRKLDTWNERTARLFACDCAAHVLHIFEKHHPKDKRPRKAIATARRFANREVGSEELAAPRAAAGAARAAAGAARVAAGDAGAAAGDAAWAAARDAERKWQVKRLFEYLDGKRG